MPEEDPDDVFLRHSGMVLDTLLSDPAFDQPASGIDASSSGSTPESMPLPEFSDFSEPMSGPIRSGPKASETISALLSGRIPASSSTMSSTMMAEAPPLTESEAMDGPLAPPHKEGDQPRPGAAATVDDLRERLLALRKRPKVLLLIGAIVAVLLILLLVATSGGGSDSSSKPLVITPSASATPSSTTPVNTDKPIQPKSADSSCPPGSTSAMDAFDSQSGKAWDCVRAYSVDGQVMTIDLGKSYAVDSISLVPGWDHVDADGTDEWTKHRTASKISYEFDDSNETTYTQETMNQRTQVTTKIDPPVTTSKITLTILQSAGDKSINDTAISSIVITGQ